VTGGILKVGEMSVDEQLEVFPEVNFADDSALVRGNPQEEMPPFSKRSLIDLRIGQQAGPPLRLWPSIRK
jgi:hypothetical protein